MALQGFDKTYYLNAKLAALQTTYPEWASKTAADLEAYFANVGLTAEDHYNLYGWKEGLGPNAYFDAEEYKLAKATAMFDDNLYLSVGDALAAFEAAWGDQDPYLHYLQYGAAEGINPSNDFDSSDYLAAKLAALQADPETAAEWAGKTVDDLEDVFEAAGLTPLTHFVLYGENEGLAAPPVPEDEQVTPGSEIPPVEGETLTLTESVDNVQIATVNTIDTIVGVVDGDNDGNTEGSTFSVGDIIEGNGHTVLRLATVEGGDAAYASVSDVDQVNIIAGTGDWVGFNAVDWTGIGSVNLVSGVDTSVWVENLESGAGLSISDAVGGWLGADYTNDTGVQVHAERASAISFLDGDVNAVAAADEDVKFSMWAQDDDVNVVVRDVSMVGTGADWAGLYIGDWSSDKAGDVTVGNVTIEGFDDVDMYIDNYNYTDTVPANLTVGDVALAVNKSGDLSASIENYGYNSPVGNLTVGNVAIDLAVSATGYLSIDNSGPVYAGNLTVGDVTVKLATDASLSYLEFSNYAYNSGAATAGNLTVGNISLDMGINSYLYGYNDLYASGGAGSKAGNVTIGDFTALVDDGGDLYYYLADVTSYGDVGNVTQGNLDLTLGVSASATLYNEVYSYGGDIGDYSRGDVSLVAGEESDIYMSDYLSATTGDIGDITIGNVSLSADIGASVTYSFTAYATSNEIGNITVGDVSVSAVGKDAYAYFAQYSIDAADVGTTTYGDVALVANGEGADAYFTLYNSATDSAGDTTLGNFDLSVDVAAKKTGALVEAYLNIDEGDVTIGDITLGSTSVRGLTDVTMAYDGWFTAYADNGALTVGDITVTGGDGKADNFAFLFDSDINGSAMIEADEEGWLTLDGNDGVTIGDVDYSGYGAAATIDVSGVKGAAAITGTAKGDSIIDNAGANALTGGDGADTFVFVDTNTGKTPTTVDQILDFDNAAGDKIDISATIDEFNYSEGTHADFSTFLAAANGADKAAYSGLVAGDVWVAVDNAGDGTVDFVIQLVGVNSLGDIDIASFV